MATALKLVAREDGDKQRALEAALTQIDRAFGKGSVMRLGDKGKIVEIESVSTGSLGLDLALTMVVKPEHRLLALPFEVGVRCRWLIFTCFDHMMVREQQTGRDQPAGAHTPDRVHEGSA